MKWRIVFARSAEKDLRRLSAEARTRIGRAIRDLEEEAFPSGSKRLKGRVELRRRVIEVYGYDRFKERVREVVQKTLKTETLKD